MPDGFHADYIKQSGNPEATEADALTAYRRLIARGQISGANGSANPIAGLGNDPEAPDSRYYGPNIDSDESAYARKIAEQTGMTYEEALRNPAKAELARHRRMFGELGPAHGVGDSDQIPRRARVRAEIYANWSRIEREWKRPLSRQEKQMFLKYRDMNDADRAAYIDALPPDEVVEPQPTNRGAARAEHRLAAQFRPQPGDPYSANLQSLGQIFLGQGHLRGLPPEERSLALVNFMQGIFSAIGLIPYAGSAAQALAYIADGDILNAQVNAFSLVAGALPKKYQDKALPSLFKAVDLATDIRGLAYSFAGADANVLPRWLVPQPQQENDERH